MISNEVIKNLVNIYHENKLSHAYLIETNNIEKTTEDLKLFIKVISCNQNYLDNCTKCNLCHLIDENNLPSMIIIEPIGNTIKKEQIDNLKICFSKKPIYTSNNIYLIKNAEKMNDSSFNKMLKFLEEPEDNIIGFFITENKDNIAPTIISRCEILKNYYESTSVNEKIGLKEEEYQKLYNLAINLINKIELSSNDLIWYNNYELQKELTNRIDVINYLKIIFDIYNNLLLNNIALDFKVSNINLKINIVLKYLEELNYNVNTKLLLNSLIIEMGQLNEK